MDVKKTVKEAYGKIAQDCGGCCNCGCGRPDVEKISKDIGYSDEELAVPGNLGLGCGNPLALGKIKEGETVLDLGSGAGFDCFLAARKVGKTGKVIGVDFTEEMILKARENASKNGYDHVEFRQGDIEDLPVEDDLVDVIISNCVINLSVDKLKVFKEAYRVLKKGGRMYVSDIVLLSELGEEQKNDKDLLSGCVAGALLKEDYLKLMKKARFEVRVLSEDKDISKRQYAGINLESLKVVGEKKG